MQTFTDQEIETAQNPKVVPPAPYFLYNVTYWIHRKGYKPMRHTGIVRTNRFSDIRVAIDKVTVNQRAEINTKDAFIPAGWIGKIDARKLVAEFVIMDTEPFVKEVENEG